MYLGFGTQDSYYLRTSLNLSLYFELLFFLAKKNFFLAFYAYTFERPYLPQPISFYLYVLNFEYWTQLFLVPLKKIMTRLIGGDEI